MTETEKLSRGLDKEIFDPVKRIMGLSAIISIGYLAGRLGERYGEGSIKKGIVETIKKIVKNQ